MTSSDHGKSGLFPFLLCLFVLVLCYWGFLIFSLITNFVRKPEASPTCSGCQGNGFAVVQVQRGRRGSESSVGSGEDRSGGHDDGESGGNGED